MVTVTFAKISCLGKTVLKWFLISLSPLNLMVTEFTCSKYVLIKLFSFKSKRQKKNFQ